MKVSIIVIMVLSSVTFVACKKPEGGVKVNAKITTMEEVRVVLDQVLTKKIGLTPVTCPEDYRYINPSKEKIIEKCFIGTMELQEILRPMTIHLAEIGKVKMDWREDLGTWVEFYNVGNSGISFSLSVSTPRPDDYTPTGIIKKDSKLIAQYIIRQHANTL